MMTGFMVVAAGERSETRVYGRDPAPRVPLVSHHTEGGVSAILMGRLYYRYELAARLGAAGAEAEAGDAALALAAYRRFGVAGVERLEGEFALVIVDDEERRLIAVRDPMGGYPIYWIAGPAIVAIATGLRPLIDLLPGHTVNLGFLGEIQMLPYAEIDYCAETAFTEVRRLPSGSRLFADLRSGRVETHAFWQWPARIVDPGPGSVAEIAEGFAAALRQAVAERARGTVAAHLSGGMDSTAIALLARDVMAARGGQVHALSLVYERLPYLRDECAYLDGPLGAPGIVAHRIPADDVLDYDVFADPPLHDEPHHGLFRAGLGIATENAAAAAGADTILTGFGADELVANRPYQIADLLRGGRIGRAWAEAARWGHAQTSSSWTFFRLFGLKPVLPVALQPGLWPLLRRGYADWGHQNPSTIPPWVRPDFAREGRLRERALDYLRHNFRSAPSIVRSEALARLRYTAGDWERHTLAAPHDMLISHPFRDPRVIGFALGARSRLAPVPGQQKVLLAEAMREVLPENILRRRGKVDFNPVYFEGLARNQAALEDLVRDPETDPLGLYDKDILLRCLREAALGFRILDGLSALNNSLVILKWLSLLPQWRREQPQLRYTIAHRAARATRAAIVPAAAS